MTTDPIIPLSMRGLDVPPPAFGWPVELDRRGITTVTDDIGRECIARADAAVLIAEHIADEERKALKAAEAEAQAIEADRRWRAQLSRGIPADAVPEGVTPAQVMMASDPMDQGQRRESVVHHALAHQDGAIVFHPIGGES